MSDKFTIKVFFRGDWCPRCNGYLRDFNSHLEVIQSLGGAVIGITSQIGNQSKENNGLDFDIVIDAENVDAKKYDIFITPKVETPLAEVDKVYEIGMVQPGVVIEDADGKVLYRWAITPSEMNFGGATDRPLVADIVGALEHIITNDSAPRDFGSTDMAYLEKGHPDQHKLVMDYLASLK